MKGWTVKIIMLLAYCVPYAYLAMYGDATYGTMIFYGFMVVCLGVLCHIAIKTKNRAVLIVGNILSLTSSYFLISKNQDEIWEWYFKPFTPFGLLLLITIIALVVQAAFLLHSKRQRKEVNH